MHHFPRVAMEEICQIWPKTAGKRKEKERKGQNRPVKAEKGLNFYDVDEASASKVFFFSAQAALV